MEIVLSRLAYQDLEAIIHFIADENGNPKMAQTIKDTIFADLRQLQDYPKSGRKGRVKGTRELVLTYNSYVAVYRVSPDRIEIARVLHTSRKYP